MAGYAPEDAVYPERVHSIFTSNSEQDQAMLSRHYKLNVFGWANYHDGEGVEDDVDDLQLRLASRLRARQERLDGMPIRDVWAHHRDEMRDCDLFMRGFDFQQSADALSTAPAPRPALTAVDRIAQPPAMKPVGAAGPMPPATTSAVPHATVLTPIPPVVRRTMADPAPLPPVMRRTVIDHPAAAVGVPRTLLPQPAATSFSAAVAPQPSEYSRPYHGDYLEELRRVSPEGFDRAVQVLGTMDRRHAAEEAERDERFARRQAYYDQYRYPECTYCVADGYPPQPAFHYVPTGRRLC